MKTRRLSTPQNNSMKIKRARPRWSNLHDVYVAMLAIAEWRSLSVVMLMTYQGKLAVVEGVAHEFAHQLEAGRNFDLRLRASSDEEANEHEAATLRIEIAALAMLDVRVSLRYPGILRDYVFPRVNRYPCLRSHDSGPRRDGCGSTQELLQSRACNTLQHPWKTAHTLLIALWRQPP